MRPKELFTPGPTRVPWEVLEAMARPLIHHRTPEFRAVLGEATENLQYVYRTKDPILLMTASGSGAMEAAMVNLTRPGEKALVAVVGKFSDRWRELGETYGVDLVEIGAKWGDAIAPAEVEAAFKENPDIRTVYCTHCETSTGVLQDVEAIARIAHEHDALVVVDAITSLCAEDVRTDDWGLDVVVGGSQKGFGVPPGLSFLSVSQAAQERIQRGGHATYYFSLSRALSSAVKGDTPWTPAVTLIIALNQALRMIREEGIENVIRRHACNAAAVRAACKALGLELLSSTPANATTTVVPKEGTADGIKSHLETEYGIKIAGGQAQLKGKILRLGHLGFYYDTDMYKMISALDAALHDLKINDSRGEGVAALMKSFCAEG